MQSRSNNNSLHHNDLGKGNKEGTTLKEMPLRTNFKNLVQKGRLSDEDLERLRLDIIQVQKKKHYRTLIFFLLFLICILIILYFLAF